MKYPDPSAFEFRKRAGELLGVDPDWILCGNGSDDILTIVTRALVDAYYEAFSPSDIDGEWETLLDENNGDES